MWPSSRRCAVAKTTKPVWAIAPTSSSSSYYIGNAFMATLLWLRFLFPCWPVISTVHSLYPGPAILPFPANRRGSEVKPSYDQGARTYAIKFNRPKVYCFGTADWLTQLSTATTSLVNFSQDLQFNNQQSISGNPTLIIGCNPDAVNRYCNTSLLLAVYLLFVVYILFVLSKGVL